MTAPIVQSMRVVPVAGRDGMLLNLSGAHAPFFTRNIVIVTDNAGHTGLGEVPVGELQAHGVEDGLQVADGLTLDQRPCVLQR